MSRVLDLWAGMTGAVMDFAGTAAPQGWLMCFGQSLLRADYPNLFAVIGTTFGAADAAHFSLPDCRGRAAIGKDNMGGTAAGRLTAAGGGINGATLGAAGGAETHTLTAAQMPAHNHAVSDPGHAHSVYDPGHNHNINANYYNLGAQGFGTVTPYCGGGQVISTANVAAATGIGIYAAATGISTQTAGTGGAHPNAQPGIVFNKIIKA